MRHMRAHLPALSLYLSVVAVCISLAAVSACTKNQRLTTIQASLVAVDAASNGFRAYSLQHQRDIVAKATSREDMDQQIDAYRKDREKYLLAFEIAYRALAVAATQTDDPSLAAALARSAELVETIKKLTGGP